MTSLSSIQTAIAAAIAASTSWAALTDAVQSGFGVDDSEAEASLAANGAACLVLPVLSLQATESAGPALLATATVLVRVLANPQRQTSVQVAALVQDAIQAVLNLTPAAGEEGYRASTKGDFYALAKTDPGTFAATITFEKQCGFNV